MIHHRIVSLLPAATEMVCALGCGDQLVGSSHECDIPPEITALPACTSPKINLAASGAEIDRQTKELAQSGKSLYHLDSRLLRELKPDLILTQGQCEVCAVSEEQVIESLAKWPGSRPRIIALAPKKFADLWDDFRTIATALAVPENGKPLVQALKNRCVNVIFLAAELKNRPSVACIEWMDPLMAAGNWTPDLVELAGGVNLFGASGAHSPWLTWEELATKDPEVIIVMPCGYDVRRTRAELPVLAHRPGWTSLRAVKSGRVSIADGSQFFNRPGPRLIDSLEIMAEILYPKLFKFGHEGKAWERL